MRPLTIFHTESSPGWGGQEIRIFSEMLFMRQRGHRLTLIAPTKAALFQNCQKEGIEVIPVEWDRELFISNVFKLQTIFRERSVDVVNPHSSRDGWVAGLAARFARVPLLIRSRHIEVDYPNRLTSSIAFARLPHYVITTSERIRRRLIDELAVPHNRIDTVPTGIDTDRFQPRPSTLRQETGIPADHKIVGMISVLRSWKGHIHFIEAARELSKTLLPLHFVIAGDGPQRDTIRQLLDEYKLNDKITLLGHRHDVDNILAGLDCLCLPSTAHEGVPQIILQAHAVATPVIATRIGGIPEVVTDRVTGRLVAPQNSSELASAINDTLLNPDQARTWAKRAQAMVRSHYSQEAMAIQLELIYQKFIRN